jgi:carboxylesterase type B
MNRRDVLQGMGAAMMLSTASGLEAQASGAKSDVVYELRVYHANEGKLALAPGMCGASAEEQAAAQPLATRMSEMLIAFARTGDPNCKEIPQWASYDLNERNTMIFDTETRVEKDPRGAERVFAAGAHYRQPGT